MPSLGLVNEREKHPGGGTTAALIRRGSEIGPLGPVCLYVKIENSVPRDWRIVRLADHHTVISTDEGRLVHSAHTDLLAIVQIAMFGKKAGNSRKGRTVRGTDLEL
jgi:hypothetical protein